MKTLLFLKLCLALGLSFSAKASDISPGGVPWEATDTELTRFLEMGTVPAISDAAAIIKNTPRDSLEIRRALYALLDDPRPGERARNSDGTGADFGFGEPCSVVTAALCSLLKLELSAEVRYRDSVEVAQYVMRLIDANPEVLTDLDADLSHLSPTIEQLARENPELPEPPSDEWATDGPTGEEASAASVPAAVADGSASEDAQEESNPGGAPVAAAEQDQRVGVSPTIWMGAGAGVVLLLLLAGWLWGRRG